MDPRQRTLLKVVINSEEREETADCVERANGQQARGASFAFIQENAAFATALLVMREGGRSLNRRESASRLGD